MTGKIKIAESLRSFRVQFFLAALSLLLLIVFLVAFIRFYVMDAMRSQVAQTNYEVISLYLKDIDTGLANSSKALANFLIDNAAFAAYINASDDDEKTMSLMKVLSEMEKLIITNENSDTMILYNPEDEVFIQASSDGLITDETKIVNRQIRKLIDRGDGISYSRWMVFNLNGTGYLWRMLEREGTYLAFWINIEQLPTPNEFSNFSASKQAVFLTTDGRILSNQDFVKRSRIDINHDLSEYYISGEENKWIVIGKGSTQGNFVLLAATEDNSLLFQFPYISEIILFITICMVLYLVLYILFMNRALLVPMKKLRAAMLDVSAGHLDARLDPDEKCTEFKLINRTFNDMTTQIHDLKIDVYEQKISHQQFELEHLKLQVNPHFFLNSLSIIYTLAKSGNSALIMKMSMHLVKYFRYMFANRTHFVPLGRELEHITNYIAIQQLRFPEHLVFQAKSPDFLADFPVPPLCVHTFVENAIKYSISMEQPLIIDVAVDLQEGETQNWLRIRVTDNGDGYSPEILARLENQQPIIDDDGEHIGIANLRNRLAILYNGRAQLICCNGEPGGTVNTLLIPFKGAVRHEPVDR